jgi:hypothetical protein
VKKTEVDTVTTEYNAVKDKHTATQTALSSAEDLLQTLLTGLAGTSAQSAGSGGGGGYMGQIADARARLAQAAAEEEQVRVRLEMSGRELGELEKRWKAVEREAGQGERDVKRMQADVEGLRKMADESGWNAEKEQASEEAMRSAKDEALRCTQVRVAVSLQNLLDMNQFFSFFFRNAMGSVQGYPSSILIIHLRRGSTCAKSRVSWRPSSSSNLKIMGRARRLKLLRVASCTMSS